MCGVGACLVARLESPSLLRVLMPEPSTGQSATGSTFDAGGHRVMLKRRREHVSIFCWRVFSSAMALFEYFYVSTCIGAVTLTARNGFCCYSITFARSVVVDPCPALSRFTS